MSATPWINTQTAFTSYVGSNISIDPGWSPNGLVMSSQVIQYSLNTTWQFNPEQHFFNILHDGTSGQTLQIQLPVMANLKEQSMIWFFWLRGSNTAGSILQFIASADSSSINNTAGPSATFSYTNDGTAYLFMVVALNGNYFIKTVQGRNTSVIAGTGTVVTGGPATYTVSSFAGMPMQLPNVSIATATIFYGGNGIGNATETAVNPVIISQPGVISNLYVASSAAATATHTLTVRKGSTVAGLADTTLTCALASTALAASDVTHSFTVLAGDIITVKDVQSGGTEVLHLAISFLFKPSAV